MQNKIIRSKSREKKIPLWRIAQTLGVSEATMTRCLRNELPAAEQARICAIIDKLAKEGR